MIINHNIASLNTYHQLSTNNTNSSKSLEKLSSGLRINRAGDDAAGLAISEKMRGQIRGLDQAQRNAQDGISMIQTAEGALNETHSILQRMRELAVQSANDTNIGVDRSEIQKEMDQLAIELTRIANNTEFNQQTLLNGGITENGINTVKFHVGANAGQNIELSINAMDAKTLGVSRDKVIGGTVAVATETGSNIDTAALKETEFGAGILNGAVLTFDYTAAVTASSATPPDAIDASATAGFKFTFSSGASLNGYTITLGTISASTPLSVAVDTSGKTITINGDFSTDGLITATDLQSAINNELSAKGITQTVAVEGTSKQLASATDIGTIEKGADETVESPATLKITSSKGHTQTLNIVATDSSLKVTTGVFKGLEITMKTGQTLADISESDDELTLSVASSVASAAQFSGHSKVADAVTGAGIDVSSQEAASAAITTIQNAIEMVSAERSKLGAYQNRLEHTINNLSTSSENLTAAESRIRDVDMAKEMMEYTKNNILQQAAQAMLAQANQLPQGILQLLR